MDASRPGGHLTFMFTDIEGSTRILAALREDYGDWLAAHQRLVRAALATHRGVEVSTEGDSFFAVFDDPPGAVAAAAEIERGLAAHVWPAGAACRVRIGLHVGQAVLAGSSYVGIDINRAARISAAGHGGQVLLSDELRLAIGDRRPPGVSLHDLGRHRLKDVGAIRLWELEIEGLDHDFGPLRTLEAHPTNLPIDTTPLIDREAESATLRRLVLDGPLVTVTGPGGIGKSRLAVHVARGLVGEFPDGVFHLDLAAVDRADAAAAELIGRLGARTPPDVDPVTGLVDALRDRHALILLETVDRVEGMGALASRLAAACPATRILVTARSPLHVQAEREVPVEPLATPPVRADPEAGRSSPAVALFVDRAAAVGGGFQPTASDIDDIAEIVRRLDGVPLAIELAAARTRTLAPRAILARLERALPLLARGPVDAPERQRALRDTIAWSYRLLDPPDQAMLQRLSVLTGEFTIEEVEAIGGAADAADGPDEDAEASFERLVDRSLVQRVGQATDRTWRLLGTIREFAADELDAGGNDTSARVAHARHWLDVVERERAALDGPGEAEALASLDRAVMDVVAAIGFALEVEAAAGIERAGTAAGDAANRRVPHLALRLSVGLGRYWYLRGRVHEAGRWLDRAIAADPDAPDELRAAALHWSGVMADERRESATAIERFEAALAIERRLDDPAAIARELNSLGVVHRNVGDLDRAAELLDEALARRRALGEPGGIATVLTNLGIVAIDRGRYEEARDLLAEALELDRAAAAVGGTAYSSAALGAALLGLGRRAEATALFEHALAVFSELDDGDGVAESLERLAEVAMPADPSRAGRLVFAAEAIREREAVALRGVDQARLDALVSSITAALEPAALATAMAEGRAMDTASAVAFARAGDPAARARTAGPGHIR
jgi:predicted ATPase/class 3 adenylate cyclase